MNFIEIKFRRDCVDGKGVLPANTGCQIRNRLSLKQVYVERGASMHATGLMVREAEKAICSERNKCNMVCGG